MSRKHQRSLHLLMASHGFHLHRKSKHIIWKNADGLLITTSSTPSDANALRQINRQVIRKLAEV